MVRDDRKARLLGFALDGADGELRVTRGENFHLVGGSQDTHESMQEKCMRFNEKLDARGKSLDDLAGEEFRDMAAECEMNVLPPSPRRQ